MPTAIESFTLHSSEIQQLAEIHVEVAGSGPGRKRVEVLHKAAFVLITAFWEAFCEDLAEEALEHVLLNAVNASVLPVKLRADVAKRLKKEDHELAIWELADDKWRGVIRGRMVDMTEERNRRLNTPKTVQIVDLFSHALGLDDVARAWHWSGMSAIRAQEKLDDYVSIRGAIAHRGRASVSVTKADVLHYQQHVTYLSARTHKAVADFVTKTTGVSFV